MKLWPTTHPTSLHEINYEIIILLMGRDGVNDGETILTGRPKHFSRFQAVDVFHGPL